MLRVFPWNIRTVLLSVEIIFEVPDGVHLAEAGFQRGSYVTEGHFSPLCNQCRAQLLICSLPQLDLINEAAEQSFRL